MTVFTPLNASHAVCASTLTTLPCRAFARRSASAVQLQEIAEEYNQKHSTEESMQPSVLINIDAELFVSTPHGSIHLHVKSFCKHHTHLLIDKQHFVRPRADEGLLLRTWSHLCVRKGLHAHGTSAVQGPCSDLVCGYGVSLGVRVGNDEPALALISWREGPIDKGFETCP